MNFVAIDVETANANLASICQIGLVSYENGILADAWKTYVDPEDYFHNFNISIHGIDKSVVEGAPKFPELTGVLRNYLEGRVVVSHTSFDRAALYRAARRYDMEMIACTWLDSAQVARRTWKECARRGYGLSNLCKILAYDFKHHDALEDARAAAHIMFAAADKTGLNIEGWLKQLRQPLRPRAGNYGPAIRREGNQPGR